jgi:hypothetical protein
MSTTVQQAPGIKRIDLQQHDLSIPGREVIQNRLHAVRTVGSGPAAELATYVVEKGKPFLVVVE